VAQLAFVGQRTAERVGVLAQVRSPVALYGPEWGGAPEVAHHAPHSRRVQPDELAAIYARHMAVLNMRNEQYVLHGLNQRSFEPYAFGTPVVSDAQPDLPLCFDPGREVLVYRDAAQLNEIYDALRGDMAWAVEVGRRGQQRVLAQHLYSHRLATFRSFI
jgi:spore maturation protein CgeB